MTKPAERATSMQLLEISENPHGLASSPTPLTDPKVLSPDTAIILIGAPGAGKTTTGRILASELGRTFIDVDAEIEYRLGRTIGEIFALEGEDYFRAIEADVTADVISSNTVISLGGGAVMTESVRAAISRHTVVWLQVSVVHATRRVGMNQLRPLLLGDVRSRLQALLDARETVYRQAADIVVSTDGITPRTVVASIIDGLSALQSRTDSYTGE